MITLEDKLDIMFKEQKKLQDELSNNNKSKPIKEMKTLGEKLDYLLYTKMAFDDEFRETIDALAGTNKNPKQRSSLWKNWKSDNQIIRNLEYNSLSKKELDDLKFEVVDMFSFFLNMLLVLEIESSDLYSYYKSKLHKNLKRIENNY